MLEKSAERGNAKYMRSLGVLYLTGKSGCT